MLKKLMKYDLKYMNRYLIIIHGFLLLVSAAMRLFLTGPFLSADTDWESPKFILPLTLLIILYIMIIVSGSFATSIVIAVRFYKNLFSEQGYLTRTLPVTSGQHLLAKTISGSIWSIINIIVTMISMLIVLGTPFIIDSLKADYSSICEELGMTGSYAHLSWGTVIAIFVMTMVFSSVSNVVTYYASVAFGQLIPNHRVLGAIAAYFVISTVISILSLIALALSGLLGASINPSADFVGIEYLFNSLKISVILALICGVALYMTTYWIMKKKVNLD